MGGHFELESGAHFKLELGGQYHWNLQNTTAMQLQSGYKTQITKGMTLPKRYIIRRRSLFDLLFDRVADWLNPKQLEIRS